MIQSLDETSILSTNFKRYEVYSVAFELLSTSIYVTQIGIICLSIVKAILVSIHRKDPKATSCINLLSFKSEGHSVSNLWIISLTLLFHFYRFILIPLATKRKKVIFRQFSA